MTIARPHTLRSIALETDRDKRTVARWLDRASVDCQDEIGAVIDGCRYFSDDERAMLLAHEKPKAAESVPVEPDKQSITVEIGNHAIVLSQPELPQTYSLETLRQSEVIAFDDPLAIAAQFLETADVLTAEMQRDIRLREHKLQQTQQAKAAITEKATEFKLEARLYRERTAMLATAQSQETQSLQQSLTTLQNLGKPPADA
ncbi:hypothetical protein [Stenomitos frigidus]|uniref:Uncharacterized protein n=1 Tax=Stenomitos frigidus ULC18 TaxID=2107698 RepID=A0A2T1DSM9_9CYAN|nr:hypothetical protein [Stenomitos frigidus]PSB23475.1 hypothetical protein C7B82_31030 [Stenomitos frigidus ULC18]